MLSLTLTLTHLPTSHRITSHRITSHHTTRCHITSHHIASHHIAASGSHGVGVSGPPGRKPAAVATLPRGRDHDNDDNNHENNNDHNNDNNDDKTMTMTTIRLTHDYPIHDYPMFSSLQVAPFGKVTRLTYIQPIYDNVT